MVEFFVKDEMQTLIKKCYEITSSKTPDDSFEKEKLRLLTLFFNSLQLTPKKWDECTQTNIELIGVAFKNELISMGRPADFFDSIFSSAFRFVLEMDVFFEGESSQLAQDFKNLAIYNEKRFDEVTNEQITYALREMPITIIKKLLFSEEVKTYRQFNSNLEEAKRNNNEWTELLNRKQAKVDELNKILTRQESAYNFVGLYAGFSKLGRIKSIEFKWARVAMFSLGGAILIPLIAEICYLFKTTAPIGNMEHVIKAIPVLSITFILIYYFRVALNNYNSVRAQLMQIELRKTLCRFIQSYSEYAKELKAENQIVLSKFEDVIFSNIMTSEEKTPSTFDGIEQIVGVISALKNGVGK